MNKLVMAVLVISVATLAGCASPAPQRDGSTRQTISSPPTSARIYLTTIMKPGYQVEERREYTSPGGCAVKEKQTMRGRRSTFSLKVTCKGENNKNTFKRSYTYPIGRCTVTEKEEQRRTKSVYTKRTRCR